MMFKLFLVWWTVATLTRFYDTLPDPLDERFAGLNLAPNEMNEEDEAKSLFSFFLPNDCTKLEISHSYNALRSQLTWFSYGPSTLSISNLFQNCFMKTCKQASWENSVCASIRVSVTSAGEASPPWRHIGSVCDFYPFFVQFFGCEGNRLAERFQRNPELRVTIDNNQSVLKKPYKLVESSQILQNCKSKPISWTNWYQKSLRVVFQDHTTVAAVSHGSKTDW
jgi:hypothetical protein